jgi:hypothetical protein
MGKKYQMTLIYTKWAYNRPIGRKIYQMYTPEIFQYLPLQEPLKFTRIGIFLKNIPSGNPGWNNTKVFDKLSPFSLDQFSKGKKMENKKGGKNSYRLRCGYR